MAFDIVDLVKNLGFPVVAFLLMYRMTNNSIKENTNAIDRMGVLLEKLMWQIKK